MSFLLAEKCAGVVGSLLVLFLLCFFSSMCQQNGTSPFIVVKCERILARSADDSLLHLEN